FLHSIMPSPVRSLSSLTADAVISAIGRLLYSSWILGTGPAGCPARPLVLRAEANGAACRRPGDWPYSASRASVGASALALVFTCTLALGFGAALARDRGLSAEPSSPPS